MSKMDTNISVFLDKSEEDLLRKLHSITYIFSLVVHGITFVLGLLGNGLVIWVAGFRMTRTVTTVSYLNLALADFSFIATLPFIIVSLAKDEWPFHLVLCKFIYFVGELSLYGSIFLITVIALDRCIVILRPVWAQNHRTVGLAVRVITGLWISALILTLPVLKFMTTVKDDETEKTVCSYAFHENMEEILKVITPVSIIRFIIAFSIPMSVITICYGLLAAHIRKKSLIKSSRALRVLTAVIVSFFLCWFPVHLVALLIVAWSREMMSRKMITSKFLILLLLSNPVKSLAAFNSCLNPILYVFVGQNFQKRLIRLLPARLEKALSEDLDQANDTTANFTSPSSDSELQATELQAAGPFAGQTSYISP